MADDFDFDSTYNSVVSASESAAAESGADATPPPVVLGDPADPAVPADPADATDADQATPPEPVATAAPTAQPPASKDEFFLDEDFLFEDDELVAQEAPKDAPLPTLERFASVTDPAERADLARLIEAASNNGSQFAPLAPQLELVGGVEPASRLLQIIGLGKLGDTPAYREDGTPLGMTHLQWAVKALDTQDRQFFDSFVGQALKYAPELAYNNLPALLEAVDTDKNLPPAIREKVGDYLQQYAERKGYELNIDAETQKQMLEELPPTDQKLFHALSAEDKKAIVETYRDFGINRALREFDSSLVRFNEEQKDKAQKNEAVVEAQYEEGFKSNATFSNHIEKVYDSYVQKLVQSGVDEIRAEGLVSRAYKQMLKGSWDKSTQEHQVMMTLQQAMLPKNLRHPKYVNIGATPQERQNLELALRRVFKSHLDKTAGQFRRPGAATTAKPGNQPPQQQRKEPPAAERQFEPEPPPKQEGEFVPTTSDDIERMINNAMAQYR